MLVRAAVIRLLGDLHTLSYRHRPVPLTQKTFGFLKPVDDLLRGVVHVLHIALRTRTVNRGLTEQLDQPALVRSIRPAPTLQS